MNDFEKDLVARGLARVYRGRLIPIMQGGSDEDEPLFAEVPDDLTSLSDEDLQGLVEDYEATLGEIQAWSRQEGEFELGDLTVEQLFELYQVANGETMPALQAEVERRAGETSNADADAFAALANAEPEVEPEVAPEEDAAVDEPVVAAAPPARRGRLPRPAGQHAPAEHVPSGDAEGIPLIAAAGAGNLPLGMKFGSEKELAEAMISRHRQFGQTGPGTIEKVTIATANWQDSYPDERHFTSLDEEFTFDLVKRISDPAVVRREFRDRVHEQNKDMDAMVASGGLCAPVTPWYNLQYISVPTRPVMGALPSFMADRGGLLYARPAALSAVTDAVGLITESEDAAGGSSATKSCQVIPCPPFQQTDVDIIYHCLQFGNLGARTFPELVAQWNNLVLAAHARLAESNLLTQIDSAGTQVTAGALGLGASATLFSQILAAANGIRSRNRMDPEAVLRLLIPWWSVDLIVSDVIRSQFQRFDTDRDKVIALLRSFNVEPSFYIDSASGRNQVWGTQPTEPVDSGDPYAGLIPFPTECVWYLFPEASFLYLDGGMLELGIVRDSVLNKTNDFQIFGETFENVAFVGVESLTVLSSVCDSGTVSLPTAVTCGIDYEDRGAIWD